MKSNSIQSVITNNFTDPNHLEKVAQLWKDNQTLIQNQFRKGACVFMVYNDYASNYKGDYALDLTVSSKDEKVDFESTPYKWVEYHVDTQRKDGLKVMWEQIWKDEKNLNLNRTYTFDYEEYDPDGSITIYISVK